MGDPTQCDALCKAQPECQSPGNTCTSQAFVNDRRCYCSYSTNGHVSNGRCVACPPGTTSDSSGDPSEGKDTGCECPSTVTIRAGDDNYCFSSPDWPRAAMGPRCDHQSLTCDDLGRENSNTHDFNPANGELLVHACVDRIDRAAFYKCQKIKKVTFKHTVSNPVTIEGDAFYQSGVETVDVPPRATFKKGAFRQARALKRLVFRDDSDYSTLKIEAQAFESSGVRSLYEKEVLLCAPLSCASTPVVKVVITNANVAHVDADRPAHHVGRADQSDGGVEAQARGAHIRIVSPMKPVF